MKGDTMHCNACKWWRMPSANDQWDIGLHDMGIFDRYDPDTFEFVPALPELRYCTSPRITENERPVESDWATVVDGSGYRAKLITGGDFGCVQFEQEETR